MLLPVLRSIVPYGLAILAVSPSSAAGAAELPVYTIIRSECGGQSTRICIFPKFDTALLGLTNLLDTITNLLDAVTQKINNARSSRARRGAAK